MPVTRVIPMKSLREVEYVDACMKLSEVPQIKALDATILSSRTKVSPCLKVTATSDKVNEAFAAVERLISNIGHERHIYSGAGESKVLDKHQDALKAKVKELGCGGVAQCAEGDGIPKHRFTRHSSTFSPPAKEKRPPLPPRLPKPRGNQKVIIGNAIVILRQGDITKEVVDAIVNSTNSSLKLDTGVSGAILEAAGKSVVDECAKLGTQEDDGVVVTGGGNLKCKHIIHMVGQSTAAGITSSIEKVLQLCKSKNIKSLSIPAVGTGQGKINAEESIKAIFMGLQNHLCLTTSTSIKFVFIVAFEPKIFASFCQYFSKWKQQSPPPKRTVSGPQSPSIQAKSTLLPANQVKISGVRIEVKKGDITTEGVRAIVNSTNKELNLKGGVSGAIFRAAGSLIEMECKKFGPQKDDGVVVTSGGQLQCDLIIHMVGPRSLNAATSQVENVLEQCEKNNISTVSFPAIGTGGGQLNAADVICAMLQGFRNHLSAHSSTYLKLINIVVYEDKIFQESLRGLKQWSKLQLDKSVEDKGNDGEDAEDVGSSYEWNSSDEKEEEDDDDRSIEVIMGPIKVKALCGDITKERTDVIVNSTNTNLDLSKGVSGAILKVAGQAVLNECKTLGPQPSDGVVLTKPGNLKCKHIAHMVGQTKAQAITNSMYKVLETCDLIKAQSVSFPALGTGAGNLAASQVANAMFDAISNFLLDKPKSSVIVVHIVIFQPKMMSNFEEVMKKFKRVHPKFGGAAAKAVCRTTLLRSPNSSWSQGTSTFNLETATARISFPVTVAEVYGTSEANLAQAKKVAR
ncbi:hypothetical protein GJAV_G00258930 [Gymnothorax javanicus]|nr:hypothetical protein GJAV_G00258930 [Gymnothorax javanicus]